MVTRLVVFAILLLAINANISTAPLQKNETVYMLALLPLASMFYANNMGPICRESMQIVIDSVNANPNILPNHRIDMEIGNDQCNEAHGRQEFVRLVGLQRPASAVLLGPLCYDASEVVGRLTHTWSMVQVVPGYYTPSTSPGPEFPSLYRVGTSQDILSPFRFWFLKKMGWNKVAVISEMDPYYRSNDTINFIKAAANEGVSVRPIELDANLNTISEKVANLKRMDARVILVNCAFDCEAFFCEFYKAGLYDRRISFVVLNTWLKFQPDWVPDGCTWQQLQEVTDGAFLVGELNQPIDENMVTTLGYTHRQFGAELTSRSGFDADNMAWGVRLLCHDSALFGAFVLHEAEIGMRQANRSLSSFSYKDPNVLPIIMEASKRVNVTGFQGMLAVSDSYFHEIPIAMEVLQIQGNDTVRLFLYYPHGERQPEKFKDVQLGETTSRE